MGYRNTNVLNKMAKCIQPKAKTALQNIWMAKTRKDADAGFYRFVELNRVQYDKAVACLQKDRDALLAFYNCPAEHWKHLRTTNPVESTFATMRHRTIHSKGCLLNKTILAMVFKLIEGAQKTWRRPDGQNLLPKLIANVKFKRWTPSCLSELSEAGCLLFA